MTHGNHSKPTGAGKSSFGLIDTDIFFRELDLQEGIVFLSPDEVTDMLFPYGFKKERLTDVGPYNYLTLFKKA